MARVVENRMEAKSNWVHRPMIKMDLDKIGKQMNQAGPMVAAVAIGDQQIDRPFDPNLFSNRAESENHR